jgi:ABC-type branched-subunit amino acid transport system ATPase component/branched-subunit amino acid ABC-type transport system permease component
MNLLLPFIISGITTGSIYGLAAAGLVLTYKTSGVLNFAHGAVAAAAAYFFYWLNVDQGIAWGYAFVLSVFVLGPVLGVLFEILGKRLAPQSSAMKIVGTIGLILIVEGFTLIKFGENTLTINQFLPGGNDTFKLAGVVITNGQVIVTAISVVAVAALYFFFRMNRTGLVMRAVVDNADLVEVHGSNSRHARRVAWIIGITFAAMSGVLLAPLVGIDVVVLTYLIVQACGAAAAGVFSSIPITFLAGILLGIATAISTNYVISVSWLSGLPSSLPFAILLIVLLVTPKRRLAPPSLAIGRRAAEAELSGRAQGLVGIVVVGVLALLPVFDSTNVSFFTVGLAEAIMLLSLGLLVRTSGQISLAHAAFAGLGAVACSQFANNLHMPWLIAVLLGALVIVPIGALVAIPAIRLSGLFLALATLGFGLLVEQLIYPLGIGFTTLNQGRVMSRPTGFASDTSYYYLVLAFLCAIALVTMAIHRARFGRLLRGISDSAQAVGVMGLNVEMTKVIVFCISAFIAALSGILYGTSVHFAVSSDPYFTSFNSLLYLAILALAPFSTPWYAIFGILPWVVNAYIPSGNTTYWLDIIFGVFAVQTAISGGAPSMPPRVRAAFERIVPAWARRRPPSGRAVASSAVPRAAPPPGTQRGGGLQVRDVSVRFGGIQALSNVSLDAPLGRITGLIGPNGAGKTTLFNACSGINRSVRGRVLLHGDEVTRLRASARGRRGLGRTFQIPQVCETLSVRENVALGAEASMAGSNVVTQLLAMPGQRSRVDTAVDGTMELCGITYLAGQPVGSLSSGQRRLVELARCLAGPFDVLLLDEPSSGLDRDETLRFGEILSQVAAERERGILLVEHDMSLVMGICDHVYVLDFGKQIFDGTPAEVAASELVRSAYLGSPDAEELAGGETT